MPADFSKLSFLVVDDNSHMLKIVRTILSGFGVTKIFEAASGKEALEILRGENIDIAILDYQMEEMNGIELIKYMRDETRMENPFIPIIMLSAYSEKTRVIEARDTGATEFCAKPVRAIDLYRKIGVIIDRTRPFVRTSVFFGPDRRRHDPDKYKGPERRSDDEATPNTA
ncbi:response regulator [Hyphobacterium sp. HN65]|uniref:Response regulator n=1 Tax=Hyphobacterium lacteum TaxID=3116575 RepID=A0ABU7LT46_9PROT|nr:response regulator [Hyphobacterium sp. HN65]MEE2527078.1 response regulator [Hyphobacterium sp. HN65]